MARKLAANSLFWSFLALGAFGCSGSTPGNPANGSGGTTAPRGTGGASTGSSTGGLRGSGGAGRVSTGGSSGSAGRGGAAGLGGLPGLGSGGANSGGAVGTGGRPTASGGTSGTAGTSGASGGSGGAGTVASCTFTVTPSLSTAIRTVGVVQWSTDLPNLTSAQIEFTLMSPQAGEINTGGVAPVDLTRPMYRTLLLGLKQNRTYSFHVVANAGGSTCRSQDYPLMTGALTLPLANIQHTVQNAAGRARGFIVTSGGTGAAPAIILDTDGAIVWAFAAPLTCSRARMNYEGTDMWMLELNVDNAGGEMRRVSMDGLETENNVTGLARAHHDFTVLPGGIVAAPSWITTGRDPASDLLERSPDGTIRTVVRIDNNIYRSTTFHANSILYHAADDSYTVGDRNPNLYVKLSRAGMLLWQFGGTCTNTPAPKCAPGTWQVNHGHHLLPSGNILFFNNGAGQGALSTAFEYQLTEAATSLTATQVWMYRANGVNSNVMGDVQRLPNGNTLVTYSTPGQLHEVSATSALVESFSATSLGYAEFRETLYGPPPR